MKCSIVIGSSEYLDRDCLDDLPAAKNDAESLHALFIDPEIGAYSPERSHKLISPTLPEVKSAMAAIVNSKGPDDSIFSFTFSGHGAIKNDSLYLCLKDTKGNLLSTTALPMHEVLAFALEAGFAEVNLVIDACQAGGSISDLSKLANINNFGLYQSPSVGILAGCYADQAAAEGKKYGVLSEQVIKCLKGELLVSRLRPHLSLSEVAAAISQLNVFDVDQKPVFHGASLAGPGQFSKNLKFPGVIPENPVDLRSLHEASKSIFSKNPAMQKRYLKIVSSLEELDPYDLNNFLSKISSVVTSKQFEEIAIGIFLNLKLHAQDLEDKSVMLDVASLFHGFALSICDATVRASYQEYFVLELKNAYDLCLTEIQQELLATHPFSYSEDGIAGFVLYPKRVTEAAALLSQYAIYFPSGDRIKEVPIIAVDLFSTCRSGFRIVDDEQSQNFVSLISAYKLGRCPFGGSLAEIFSDLYFDLQKSDCQILNIRKDDDDVYRYLLFRGAPDRIKPPLEVLSRPSISLLVVLLGLSILSKSSEIDGSIENFDHIGSRIFVPTTYMEFYLPTIQAGLNHEIGIGRDVFTSTDVASVRDSHILPTVIKAKDGLTDADLLSCLSNSTAYKDRQSLVHWV